ncbi:unnamed protein product [Euphydryas editha]|uniref:Transposable element P transposase-like RNase H C-terminal domain-containing protein n=1 Tax=Euphydryas editha TaxID=104508 RepID=A0AAU9U5F7_EUPED|nr:unnamed protein product [Euphydryas editha]
MLTRNFNQDPIENFFGNVRSLGVRNVSPNSINFEGAYKSLLLNNFCCAQSIKTNCEDDLASYFQSLLNFPLKESEKSDMKSSDADLPQEIIISESLLTNYKSQEGLQQISYVANQLIKKI